MICTYRGNLIRKQYQERAERARANIWEGIFEKTSLVVKLYLINYWTALSGYFTLRLAPYKIKSRKRVKLETKFKKNELSLHEGRLRVYSSILQNATRFYAEKVSYFGLYLNRLSEDMMKGLFSNRSIKNFNSLVLWYGASILSPQKGFV